MDPIRWIFPALQWLVLNHLFWGPMKVVPVVYYLPWVARAERGRARHLLWMALWGLGQDFLMLSWGVHWTAGVLTLFIVNFFRPKSHVRTPLLALLAGALLIYSSVAYGLGAAGEVSWAGWWEYVRWQIVLGGPAVLVTWMAYRRRRTTYYATEGADY